MPKAEEVAAPADAAAAATATPAEPEVIKKGKKDEDEAKDDKKRRQEEGREEEVIGDRQIADSVKLIVGLGNPGAQYQGTRHNVGFAVLDELARRASVDVRVGAGRGADGAMAAQRPDGDADDVLLVKPLTFMNLSGQAVGELARYFKIDVGRPADRRRRSAAAARQAAGAGARVGRRAQRVEVGDRAPRRRVRAAAARRRARRRPPRSGRSRADAGSTRTKRRRSSA